MAEVEAQPVGRDVGDTAVRPMVTGVLFTGDSQIGASVANTDDGDLALRFHVPEVDVIAPPDSPLDRLMRYAYAHGLPPGYVGFLNGIWARHFGSQSNSKWPALSFTVPLQSREGGGLEAGEPTIQQTRFCARHAVDRSFRNLWWKEATPNPKMPPWLEGHYALARFLLEQRVKDGESEVYHGGQLWAYNPHQNIFEATTPDVLMRKELLLTVHRALAKWFAHHKIPGLFAGSDNLPADGTSKPFQEVVGEYFRGNLTAPLLREELVARRGPKRPSQEYEPGKHAAVTGKRWNYLTIINARNAAMASRTGEPLYDAHQLAGFLASYEESHHQKRQRTARLTSPEELPTLSAATIADFTCEQFRRLYGAYLRRTDVTPETFLEACALRARKWGSISNAVARDALFGTGSRENARLAVLHEAMLFYAANNPSQAFETLNEAAKSQLVDGLVVTELIDGQMQVRASWQGREAVAVVEPKLLKEGYARVLVLLAADDPSHDFEYYRNHLQAVDWRYQPDTPHRD